MSSRLEALCDLFQHDFSCPAANRLHAGIARHALTFASAHRAHAAVDLLAIVNDLVDELTTQRLER